MKQPETAAGSAQSAPVPMAAVLGLTFFASISGGTFWTAIFFVTARTFEFSPMRNLALAAAMGTVYTIVARGAGLFVRLATTRIFLRTALAIPFLVQATAATLALVLSNARIPGLMWGLAIAGASASALLWPMVESYLTAGHHGAGMRAVLGRFNVTWTAAIAVPMLFASFLGGRNIVWTLVLVPVACLFALAFLPGFPRSLPHHDPEMGNAALGSEYPFLRRSTMWLAPLSFLLVASLSPVLPHRLSTLGVTHNSETLAAATWMLARCLTLVAMWKIPSWHGRWSTLLVGGAAMIGGLALVLLGAGLAIVVVGLTVFGFGLGVIYYASIYYSMSVGHATVDASGNFESAIGLGYLAGPLVGIVGSVAGGPGATVALSWAVVGIVAIPAALPFLQARRARAVRDGAPTA